MKTFLCVALMVLAPAAARASDRCPILTAFLDTGVLRDQSAACTKAKLLGGRSETICRVDFSYRAPSATELFDALAREADHCLGSVARLADDQAVNHPDSYDLVRYQHPTGTLSLSLKDKGALGMTLVFVRLLHPG